MAGVDSKDPKPTHRVHLEPSTQRITLVRFKGLTIQKGFYDLDGDSLQISLGHDDESNPINPMAKSYFALTRETDRPPFFIYRPDPRFDEVLGRMTWDSTSKWWVAHIDLPVIHSKQLGIAADPDLEQHLQLARSFLVWIALNYESFIVAAVDAAFDFDLIWDETIDQSKLASMLTIEDVNVYDGILRVWFDAGGATTDHLIHTKLNEEHEIVEMEI